MKSIPRTDYASLARRRTQRDLALLDESLPADVSENGFEVFASGDRYLIVVNTNLECGFN